MINCEFESGNKAKLRHTVAEAIVRRDDKIALVKRAKTMYSEPGKWAIPGGYMDLDETAAEAAAREALEETGWAVKIKHFLTYVDNPHRTGEENQNVVLVYVADALKQQQEPDEETDELGWFSLDKLPPEKEIAFDHLDRINDYKKWLDQKFSLPKVG